MKCIHPNFNFHCVLAIVMAFLSAACNSGDNEPGTLPAIPDWRTTLHDPEKPLPQRIDAAITGIDEDACFRKSDKPADCDWADFSITADDLDPLIGQHDAILIVDDGMVPAVEMLRYRHRVAGLYTTRADGQVASVPMQWQLPARFGEILTAFPGKSAAALQELLPHLQDAYSDHVPSIGSHGLTVFNILADLVPDNPIVFLDNNNTHFHRAAPGLTCAVNSVDDAQLLRAHAETFADALRQLYVDHGIRFVNASWGYTLASVRGPWESTCGTAPPSDEILLAILEAYRPVFDALFNTPGVFTAHAAIASPVDAHAPFDQETAAFPNRLRVGVFQHAGNEVPSGGKAAIPAAWKPLPTAPDDADIWINTGCSQAGLCRPHSPLELTLQYGMGRIAFALGQTSFTSPVLLAAAIHERNRQAEREMDNSLIRELKETLVSGCPSNTCPFIDPLAHGRHDGAG